VKELLFVTTNTWRNYYLWPQKRFTFGVDGGYFFS